MLQQIDKSIEAFQKVLQMEPQNKIALENLQIISTYTNSEQNLLTALKNDPNDKKALYDLGVLANNNGKFNNAIEYFSRLLVADPNGTNFTNALIEMAYAHLKMDEQGKAMEYYLRIVNLEDCKDTNNIILAYHALGKWYAAEKDYEKAKECYIRITELDPTDHEAYFRLGVMANDQGDYANSIIYLNEALKVKPDFSNGQVEKAFALSQLGKYPEAITCYNSILQVDPGNSDVYHKMGIIYGMMDDAKQSEFCFRKALEINPQRANSNHELGVMAHKAKNYNAAIQYFERCISVDPTYSSAYDYLAYYYLQVKEYDKAIRYYQKMVQFDPTNGDGYYKLGSAYQTIANYGEALSNFEQAVALNPKDYEAVYSIGTIYQQLNKKTEAVKYFRQALDISPQFTKAEEKLKLMGV
jgi:tetratricopeptide (TPR) repeat protein